MHDNNSSHLRTVLRPSKSEAHASDDDTELPSLREGEYEPYGRPSNKAVHALHIVLPNGEVRSQQYVHLDSDSRYTAERVTLRFLGMQPIQVVIRGRNLWRLYDYVHQHRIPWIMVASRDFAADGKPIVTSVKFEVGGPFVDSD